MLKGFTPNGASPSAPAQHGTTASQPELLEFPALQEFTELTYNLVEAIESSKRILQLSNNEIGVLRESVHSLDLKLSTAAARFDASSKQSLEATSAEIGALREGLGGLDLRLADIAQQFDASSRIAQLETSGEIAALKEGVANLNSRLSALAEKPDASNREEGQATSEQVAELKQSVASLNGRLLALAEQSVDEREARIQVAARTDSLEEQIATGSQLAELDLAGLQQALAATRSQCLMLETQQQALAIKVEGLIKRADKTSSSAPSPNVAGAATTTPLGGVPVEEDDSTISDLLSRVQRPQDQPYEDKYSRLSPSGKPLVRRRRSVKPLPLFIGGVAASAMLGSSLFLISPNLFNRPQPGTPAKTVPQPQKPLTPISKASAPPRPAVVVPKPAPPTKGTLKVYCPDVCWVEVRSVADGKTLYDSLLKGSVQFPIGKGLKVSSGRSDIVKLKINDGSPFVLNAQQMLSSRVIK
jgi:phosphoribosylcarboxyaminoimidazole (NCAIR) mutase